MPIPVAPTFYAFLDRSAFDLSRGPKFRCRRRP